MSTDNDTSLQPHPLAERFPPLSPAQFAGLVASIHAFGQAEPIVLLPDADDGNALKILDGRHRYRAQRQLGNTPWTVMFDELNFDGPPEAYVASKEQRRQMSPDQLACAAALQVDDYKRAVRAKGARATAFAAAAFEADPSRVRRARELQSGAPDLFEAVFRGEGDPRKPRGGGAALTLSRGVSQMRARRRVDAASKAIEQAPPLDANAARFFTGDALDEMQDLPAGGVRLIFADIPYNIGVDYDGDGSDADLLAEDAYLDYWQRVLDQAWRVLADDGSLFLMCASRHVGAFGEFLPRVRIAPEVDGKSADLDDPNNFAAWWHVRRVIAWHETFAVYQQGNFADSWRPIFYAVKDPSRFVWHPDAIRVPSDRQSKYDDDRADPAGRVPGSVWDFPRVVGTSKDRVVGGNANQLPVALVERVVRVASDPGDLVLDFCSGGGTTGVAALTNGRRYLGIDRNPDANAKAELRLRATATTTATTTAPEGGAA